MSPRLEATGVSGEYTHIPFMCLPFHALTSPHLNRFATLVRAPLSGSHEAQVRNASNPKNLSSDGGKRNRRSATTGR